MLKTKNANSIFKLGLAGELGWPLDKETSQELIENLGNINFIKVNKDQGITEEVLGQILETLDRPSYFIATESSKKTASTLESDFNTSLEKLNTDYIDLLEIKNIRNSLDLMTVGGNGGSLAKAKELKDKGLVNYIAASTYNMEILEKLGDIEEIDVLFLEFNPLLEDRKELYEKLSKNKILIGINPLAGILGSENISLIDYSLKEDIFTSVVFNASDKDRLELAKKEFTEDEKGIDLKELAEAFAEYGDNYCRKCGLCYPCAVNMNIPRMLEINKEFNDEDYSAIEEFNSYEKNASDCIKCGACEVRCPFGVPVRDIHVDTVKLIERYIDGNKEK